MNPIEVTQRLKGALVRYLLTTFDVNRDGANSTLYDAMYEAFKADKALVTGPFLELALPYALGESIEALVGRGVLSRRMLDKRITPPIPVSAPLYQHQQRAIERITAGHSVIVSSGTGSGKTESFLIPILNDLLERPASGVRAVLIYPLNALVNDQLDRLRRLLAGTGITFGRYTSELAQTVKDWKRQSGKEDVPELEVISREQIRSGEKLPNILITNYAMLEYLLLRPNDAHLFAYPADWRYIVLDEAHSYSGAQGIEVAYLIRRLKQRLGKQPGDLVCIGTSATLTDDPKQAIEFAKTLFGESFTTEDIIFGESVNPLADTKTFYPEISAYLNEQWDDLLDGLRSGTLSMDSVWDRLSEMGMLPDADIDIFSEDIPARLYGALINNGHMRALRDAMIANADAPISLGDAARLLFPDNQSTPALRADALRAVHHLVELGAVARRSPDQPALLPARYHLFARSPQGMWACLNPKCSARPEGHDAPWSKLFGDPQVVCDACESAVYPLYVCRTCGQVYVRTVYAEEQHWAERQETNAGTPHYFVWEQVKKNASLGDEQDEEEEGAPSPLEQKNPTRIAAQSVSLCLNPECRRTSRCTCLKAGRTPRMVTLYPVEKEVVGGRRGTQTQPVSELEHCSRCGSQSRIKGEEIATPVSLRGMTPLAVLTMELYRQLPEASDADIRQKPGGGRKLLSFYDSRQGAARYAAFLQDVFNQDFLRYMIPRVIDRLHERQRGTGLQSVSEVSAEMGWDELGVLRLSLDDDLDKIFSGSSMFSQSWRHLTSEQRGKLGDFVNVRLLAEITTLRRGRQSLESLGLLTVRYFESPPDVSKLAAAIGLSSEQTRTLITYLLDTLRDQKALTLPSGILPTHTAFGSNPAHPRIVRGNPGKGDIPWIGSTPRHLRCRIMALVLENAGLPADFEAVCRGLNAIWEWLIDPEHLVMSGVDSGAYRLDTARLVFDVPDEGWVRCDRCQRMRHGAPELPCPAARCGGRFVPADVDRLSDENYYHYVFRQGMPPMRVEEHTAQLNQQQGQAYQEGFKRGDINVLSCSTTFEMGIDLGDLQAVVMNNVPPNVANYRQRAGRAGRRVGGTAFIVTWAQDRPHDQIYYAQPSEIIRGQVRIPRFKLLNPEIRRRHLNALLFADFLRYLYSLETADLDEVQAFFNTKLVTGRHYDRLDDWARARSSAISQMLADMARMIGMDTLPPEQVIASFRRDLADSEMIYSQTQSRYEAQMQSALQRYIESSSEEGDRLHQERKNAKKLLDRLNDEPIIDRLSKESVLPSYSFPLYTVEMELPIDRIDKANLRLERDLRRAITEFAPNAELVANKRLWKSSGVRFLRETPQVYDYRLCAECNHIEAADAPGIPLQLDACPVCHTSYTGFSAGTRYLIPDGFRTDPKSGKLAGRYVRNEPTVQSIAISIPSKGIPSLTDQFVDPVIQPDGKLFFINTGPKGRGYRLCMICGQQVTTRDGKCPNKSCSGADARSVNLGHHVNAETLVIQFNPPAEIRLPGQRDLDFWYTLQTALVIGAARALQIERGDIGGALFPFATNNKDWQRSLVLYDNVPGGAGYMSDIRDHFSDVVCEAIKVLRCEYCAEDTSCTRCLRDYHNQMIYPYLKRGGGALVFLERLYAWLTDERDVLGTHILIANDQTAVIWAAIAGAKKAISLAVARIEDVAPAGKLSTWLDLLYERLQAGVAVSLLLTDPPQPDADRSSLVTADYLKLLMSRGQGLEIRQANALPDWHVIVDPDDDIKRRAFTMVEAAPALGTSLGDAVIRTTTQASGVAHALDRFNSVFQRAKRVTPESLQPQPRTQVYRINASHLKTHERKIEALVQFFSRPVQRMTVCDPYLFDHERIINRLGAYIDMARDGGGLQRVEVITRDAQIEKQDRASQTKAFESLRARFADVDIRVNRPTNREHHDRWIEITRTDGSRACLHIGRGLDFIRPDGTVQATVLIIEQLT
jgi:hypothetical protein